MNPRGQDAPTRAADIHDGKRVTWDGHDWRVWSKAGPTNGQCWLIRYVAGQPVTVAAPIRDLTTARVFSK